jgi:predicted negative regulator of RcsB-dependent stress response
MPTTTECERNAELSKLANETKEIYAKIALLELANEYRARLNRMEARSAFEAT